MLLDDIKVNETHKKIKLKSVDRECWRNYISCFKAEHHFVNFIQQKKLDKCRVFAYVFIYYAISS